MSLHSCFQPLQHAAQGVGGAQNSGILIVRHRATQQLYIEKRIPFDLIRRGASHREVQALQQCATHPNIVRLIAYDINPPGGIRHGSLWLQYCELGSLDALMLRHAARDTHLADEGFAWKVLWDLSLAVCYLRTGADQACTREHAVAGTSIGTVRGWNRIVHGDIKPSNVLMSWSAASAPHLPSAWRLFPTLVLADFGCAASGAEGERNVVPGVVGADAVFAAPEAAQRGRGWGAKADVWGVGLVLHCLVAMSQVPVGSRAQRQADPFGACRVGGLLRAVVGLCLRKGVEGRVAPERLPGEVWKGYLRWREGGGRGSELPAWAFG